MSFDSSDSRRAAEFDSFRRELVLNSRTVAGERREAWFVRLQELIKAMFPDAEANVRKPGLATRLYSIEVSLPYQDKMHLLDLCTELDDNWKASLKDEVKGGASCVYRDRMDGCWEWVVDLGDCYVTGYVKLRNFGFQRDGSAPSNDRPERSFEKRPYGDRPRPSYGDRPRPSYGDRPQGDGPSYGDRPQGDRPPFGDRKPWQDRNQGDRPNFDRPQGDRKPWQDRNQGDRPNFDRPQGDRPGGDRPWQDRRPGGGSDRPWQDRRPGGGGDRPPYRPGGDRPSGDRPWQDRRPGGGGDRPPYRPGGSEGGSTYGRSQGPSDGAQGSSRPPFRPKPPFGGKPGGGYKGPSKFGGAKKGPGRPKRKWSDG